LRQFVERCDTARFGRQEQFPYCLTVPGAVGEVAVPARFWICMPFEEQDS